MKKRRGSGQSRSSKTAPAAEPAVTSQRQLAELLGVAAKQVNKYLKDARWPFGTGPWDAATVARIRQWRRDVLEPNPAVVQPAGSPQHPPGYQSPKDKLAMIRAAGLAFDLELKKKLYHRVDECDRRGAAKVQLIREALLDVADGLPFEESVKSVVRERLRALCERFATSPVPAPVR